jgi:hypothetical protein
MTWQCVRTPRSAPEVTDQVRVLVINLGLWQLVNLAVTHINKISRLHPTQSQTQFSKLSLRRKCLESRYIEKKHWQTLHESTHFLLGLTWTISIWFWSFQTINFSGDSSIQSWPRSQTYLVKLNWKSSCDQIRLYKCLNLRSWNAVCINNPEHLAETSFVLIFPI